MVIVKTRIAPPSGAHLLVDRPRLIARLAEADKARLVVIQAPAGYGKTSLMSQQCSASHDFGAARGWWSVGSSEHGPRDVLQHLAAAAEEAFGARLEFDAQASMSVADAVGMFANALCVLDERPLHLFLDDVHLLNAEAQSVIELLVNVAAPRIRFFVATRVKLNMTLARLRSQGAVCDIDSEALRFTDEEAKALLSASGLSALSPSAVTHLNRQAEGWAAGLRLAIQPMVGAADIESMAKTFSGRRRSVSQYFAEVAFHSQPPGIRDFLLETSVLSRLTPALCSSVTGRDNAAEAMEQIANQALFFQPLDEDGKWWRYHELYRDFLQRRLADIDPAAHRELLHRASKWWVEAGETCEALECALAANDMQLLADLLEAHCEQMTYCGLLSQVSRFAAHLSEPMLSRCPQLVMALAWWRMRHLDFAETERLLNIARERIGSAEVTPQAAFDIQFMLKHREMMLSAAQDDPAQVEHCCHGLLAERDHAPPYLVSTIYAQLISARREQMHFEDFERLEARASAELTRSGLDFAAISLKSILGQTLFAVGRLDEAIDALDRGLASAIRFGGERSALAALPALPLAEILYERNELERAAELVDGHLPVAREMAFVDQLVAGHLVRPRLLFCDGDVDGALASLDDAWKVTQELGLGRFSLSVAAERVRLYLRSGQPALALRVAMSADILVSEESISPHANATSRDEMRATAWARVMISEDRTSEAVAVCKKWQAFCTQRNAVRAAVRWAVLQAHALAVSGEVRAAQRALRQGVMLAAPSRLIRSFLDEGAVIANLLLDSYASGPTAGAGAEAFARELLSILRPAGGVSNETELEEGLYGRLMDRELEILALVGKGLRNREIGLRLGLTEGTVKWYMQQIYDKVGVRRRPQAVERARQFGLIA